MGQTMIKHKTNQADVIVIWLLLSFIVCVSRTSAFASPTKQHVLSYGWGSSLRIVPSRIRLLAVEPKVESAESSSKTGSSKEESTKSAKGKESSNDSSSENENKKYASLRIQGKTFYEILGADPTATRSELKRRYVILAKETHPDALIGQDGENGSAGDSTSTVTFAEIADAWRVLSDPKERRRYDRSLQAEAFSARVEKVAFDVGKRTGPTAKRIFENVAIPLMRRTTATTMATITAVAEDLINNASDSSTSNSIDIGRTVSAAVKAGQAASQLIDADELQAKAEDLVERAAIEMEKALQVKDKLTEVMDRRLALALQTPNSNLTSSEATSILDSLNTVDSVSFGDILRLKHTVQYEIGKLQDIETEYSSSEEAKMNAENDWEQHQQSLKEAEKASKRAVEAEIEARRVLEEAKKRVTETSQSLTELKKETSSKEHGKKKATHEVERLSGSLGRRQEKVRKVLKQKRDAVRAEQMKNETVVSSNDDDEMPLESSEDEAVGNADDEEPETMPKTHSTKDDDADEDDDDFEVAMEALLELQREENILARECREIEESVGRMQSRAQKLFNRVDEINALRGKR